MKTGISSRLLGHYAGASTTLTTCWKVTRKDGKTFGYTALDSDLPVQGRVYSATIGAAATSIAASNNLDIQNVEISGLLQEGLMAIGAMTEADILAGVWDGARITIFEVNYRDTSMGIATLQTGVIGEMKTGRITYTAELRGLMQKLQQQIGKTVTPGCWKDLGDQYCRVDLSLFTVTGTVTSVSDQRAFTDTSRTEVDQWFRFGKITWLTSLNGNAGLSKEVKASSTTGLISLQDEMPYPIAPGDTYSMYAGCNKLLKSGGLGGTSYGTAYHVFSSTYFTAALDFPTGYFTGGSLTVTSGANANHTYTIASSTSTVQDSTTYQTFILTLPMGATLQVGDGFSVVPDPNHASTFLLEYLGDCKVKFNNSVMHGGFCETPGDDRVLGGGN